MCNHTRETDCDDDDECAGLPNGRLDVVVVFERLFAQILDKGLHLLRDDVALLSSVERECNLLLRGRLAVDSRLLASIIEQTDVGVQTRTRPTASVLVLLVLSKRGKLRRALLAPSQVDGQLADLLRSCRGDGKGKAAR